MNLDQLAAEFSARGHVTVPDIFGAQAVAAALVDLETWSHEFLDQLDEDQRKWYVEGNDATGLALRKLDEPIFHRPVFRQMAASPQLVAIVEHFIGAGVSVFFSQVFCKPPTAGGPKPVHQDNFYFGPANPDAVLTVWIALDSANVDNGCLWYGDGSHRGPVYHHWAPTDEPFNLQIPVESLDAYIMTPAPVDSGGVSLHHGNTWHQSSANRSLTARRAVAIHYINNRASLTNPALNYDASKRVRIS